MIIQEIQADLQLKFPEELVDALIESFGDIERNYMLGRHNLDELERDSVKFAEAFVRILEFEVKRTYTSFDNKFKDLSNTLLTLENQGEHVHRLIKVLSTILDLQQTKSATPAINSNYTDATLVKTSTAWLLAELYRFNYRCSYEKAQRTINALLQRELPLVSEMDNIKRVLNTKLTQKNKTLLLLAVHQGEWVTDANLIKWIEPSNTSTYRRDVLRPLHQDRMIEYKDKDSCIILEPGLKHIKDNFLTWTEGMKGVS